MISKQQTTLDRAVGALRRELGENLLSCSLYGSAVRGNAIEGVSDINLLIILNHSNSGAHEGVARAIGGMPQVVPFVLAKRGIERSIRAFTPKFASIRRNYRLLHGVDLIATMELDEGLERFLVEQAVRNLRLRLVNSYIIRDRHKAYDRFVVHHITTLFVQCSEVLRLGGITMPVAFEDRIPLLEREFSLDGQVLRDLLDLRKTPDRFSSAETVRWHKRLFPVVDLVIAWMESHWQNRNP